MKKKLVNVLKQFGTIFKQAMIIRNTNFWTFKITYTFPELN